MPQGMHKRNLPADEVMVRGTVNRKTLLIFFQRNFKILPQNPKLFPSLHHSWATETHSRPAFRALCEALRNMAVRNGDLVSFTMPDLAAPADKKDGKAVSKAMEKLREKEKSRLEADSRRSLELIQQGIVDAKENKKNTNKKKNKSKSSVGSSDSTSTSTITTTTTTVNNKKSLAEPADMELKPVQRYFDLAGEVQVTIRLLLTDDGGKLIF